MVPGFVKFSVPQLLSYILFGTWLRPGSRVEMNNKRASPSEQELARREQVGKGEAGELAKLALTAAGRLLVGENGWPSQETG